MPQIYFPLYDVQCKAPIDYCMRCGEGLNEYEAEPDEWGHVYCQECKNELKEM